MQDGWWRWLLVVVLAGGLGRALGQVEAGTGSGASIDLREAREQVTVVSAGGWRFHAGDDLTWAGAGFDDSGWKVLQAGRPWNAQGYREEGGMAWFRFWMVVPADTHGLVVEMPGFWKNYQLFADGRLIGGMGGLPPSKATATVRSARLFTLPVETEEGTKRVAMALRVWQSGQYALLAQNGLGGAMRVGAPAVMNGQFVRTKAWNLARRLGMEYTFVMIELPIAAAALLLLWMTRQRFYGWFGVSVATTVMNLATQLMSAHAGWNFGWTVALYGLLDFAGGAALALFLVGLLEVRGRRLVVFALALLALAEVGPLLVAVHLPIVWGDGLYWGFETAAQALVIWLGWRAGRRGTAEAALFLVPYAVSAGLADLGSLGHFLVDLGVGWADRVLPGNVVVVGAPFAVTLEDVANVLALLGYLAVLVYRFALTSREEQRLSAALRAAHEIQGRLVPGDQSVHGGLRTEVVYLAAEEVGGDFCQVLPRRNGSVLVAIGDVSGKGLQAAMVGALAVGALRSMAEEEFGPGMVLARMNEVMLRSDVQGFTTCLVVEIGVGGEMTIGNAGHLAPYVNGKEMDCDGGLPLGIAEGVRYVECKVMLPREARLTLLSDGVVEARAASGELFGFERTLEVSGRRAEEIAGAAQRFGQQDDITVMTLEWSAPRVGVRLERIAA